MAFAAGCGGSAPEPEIASSAAALKEGVAKQLEKRLRERNEGHLYLERYRAALSKEGAAALEKQADQGAETSYRVHIVMVEETVRLERIVEEAEAVKKTADDFVKSEREWQNGSKRTDDEKKASEARIEAVQQGKACIDAALTQANGLKEKLAERLDAAKREHAEATKALLDALEAEAKKSGG